MENMKRDTALWIIWRITMDCPAMQYGSCTTRVNRQRYQLDEMGFDSHPKRIRDDFYESLFNVQTNKMFINTGRETQFHQNIFRKWELQKEDPFTESPTWNPCLKEKNNAGAGRSGRVMAVGGSGNQVEMYRIKNKNNLLNAVKFRLE